MAQRQNTPINVYQGDDRDYRFTLQLRQTDGTLIPWNVSGGTIRLAVKQSLSDAAALFSVTANSGYGGSNWTNGIVVVPITAANSALLRADGVYDLQVTLAGAKKTPVYGTVELQRQVID